MSTLKNILRFKITLFALIVHIVIFVFYAFYLQYHLFFIEQMQLFMLTPEHFYSYFNKPASIACYLGDFLTQFYYLRGGGAVVITLCMALLYWFSKKAVHKILNKKLGLLPILLIVIVSLFHTNVLYPLASTIALILSIFAIWGYTSLKNKNARYIIGILLITGLYFIVGAYNMVFTLGIILFEIINNKTKKPFILAFSVVIIALSIITPLALRTNYYLTKKQAFTYPNRTKLTITPDFDLEKILSLDSEWYFNRPEEVLEMAKKYKLKNKYASYYYNLALSSTENLANGLMEAYQPGNKALYIPVDRSENYMGIAYSNEVYFLIGDVNTSQHSALLATTFSPKNQSSRMLRRMVEANIINKEYAAAEKYIKMLEKTWFHSKWAKEMKTFLYDEEACTNDKWIVRKRNRIPKSDYIKANPNDFIGSLKSLLADNPYNRRCLDYLLCSYLLNKDIYAFYNTIIQEIKEERLTTLPKLYQEALLIYFAQNLNDSNKDLVNISNEIFNNFIKYTDIYAANKGNGNPLEKEYGKTYWFYFHFAKMKKVN